MNDWVTVAQGTNIWDLEKTISDFELPKGARMRVVMKTGMPWLFDMAGAELAFKPFIPDGMALKDVWGEGGNGIMEMEADPAWLMAVLLFIKAHWLALAIAGIALWTIITFIWIMVKIPAVAQIPLWLILGAAAGILGLAYVSSRGRAPPKKGG